MERGRLQSLLLRGQGEIPDLLGMLVSNKLKLLVEASTDNLWGTGVLLRDTNVLNQS